MAGDPVGAGPPASEGYPGSTQLAAALMTFFFPLISLIAALLLMGGQTDPAKRSALRTWAMASAGWIAVQAVFFIILFAAVVSDGASGFEDDAPSGICEGGPKIGEPGRPGPNGTTVFDCEFGGTATVRLP